MMLALLYITVCVGQFESLGHGHARIHHIIYFDKQHIYLNAIKKFSIYYKSVIVCVSNLTLLASTAPCSQHHLPNFVFY